MVVIEPVANEVKVEPPVKSSRKENEVTTAAPGYASDGFETASETDHQQNDDDDGGTETNHIDKQSMPSPDHSYQDSLNDDQLKQKSLEEANDAKIEGNKLFGNAQYEEALLKYDHALQLASEMPWAAELRSICHSNRATCFFELGKYEDSIKECKRALDLNP